ncbi:host cell division inhibitor Icd-like protein [Tatumella sp. UBA2305]|uniref:host cell division inhibitor Icd-like protein n=1 Tax=Tatumella sp. UBA2305 TaxID=1947647 RepID=UPI0025ED094A|nr:host cell division inhibitor Icd-like protein [Tatumella sp. UBA2305]
MRPEKETPPNGITSTERGLTTTDSESIEEAVMQNTTHPQGRHSLTQNSGTDPVSFVWIIAAVRRDCPTVKATIHHIAAATEREARRTLAKDHICFFAGRIRQEVSHA